MDESLLTLQAVMARTGLSRSKIYLDVRRGTFPAPIKIGAGRRVLSRWPQSEVEAWVQQRINECRSR